MRTRAILIISTLITVAVVVAGGLRAQPAPAQHRWEYASFLRSDKAAVRQAPDGSAVAPDVFGIYERLGGKLPREKVANTEILNLVGQRGWELVAVTHRLD